MISSSTGVVAVVTLSIIRSNASIEVDAFAVGHADDDEEDVRHLHRRGRPRASSGFLVFCPKR